MDDILQRRFLNHSVEKLRQYEYRIATCVGKLNQEQVWARGSANENAVGNLILHLSGNMRQWIVSGVGGQPDIRRRDEEFDARGGPTTAELLSRLKATVDEAVAVIEGVTAERMAAPLTIQNYKVCGMEAIYHVVEHFAMHTGQILFATKMLTGADLGFYAHLRTTAPHTDKTP